MRMRTAFFMAGVSRTLIYFMLAGYFIFNGQMHYYPNMNNSDFAHYCTVCVRGVGAVFVVDGVCSMVPIHWGYWGYLCSH
ncbi:hypothetical protein FKM82_028461 [Ascaphus truei]